MQIKDLKLEDLRTVVRKAKNASIALEALETILNMSREDHPNGPHIAYELLEAARYSKHEEVASFACEQFIAKERQERYRPSYDNSIGFFIDCNHDSVAEKMFNHFYHSRDLGSSWLCEVIRLTKKETIANLAFEKLLGISKQFDSERGPESCIGCVAKNTNVDLATRAFEYLKLHPLTCVYTFKGIVISGKSENIRNEAFEMLKKHHELTPEILSEIVRTLEPGEIATEAFGLLKKHPDLTPKILFEIAESLESGEIANEAAKLMVKHPDTTEEELNRLMLVSSRFDIRTRQAIRPNEYRGLIISLLD